ncbi:MAG: HAH_0734 family protein [Halobacteriales archaeon]
MKRLLINGDPGIRKGAVVSVDGEELVCFSVTRNGDYHGPERVQLSCLVGEAEEFERFATREFVPHFLDVESIEAEAVEVIRERGTLSA